MATLDAVSAWTCGSSYHPIRRTTIEKKTSIADLGEGGSRYHMSGEQRLKVATVIPQMLCVFKV